MLYKFLLLSISSLFVFTSNIYAADYQRIAVAGGSITEIIYRLNEQSRLVGVDSTSLFPEEAKKLPVLGYVRRISSEGVLSLNPDLFIGEDDTGPTKALAQIENVGIKTVIIKNDNSIPALKAKITQVADLLGDPAKGQALVKEIQVDIDALTYAKEHLATKDKPKVLFLLSISNGAPMAAGNETSANTVIEEAGGLNALADYQGWQKLSPESALELNPDVIIVMNKGKDVYDQVAALPHFKYTNAVKNKAVFTIDGMYLLGFGPRTPQAIVELGTMIHKDFPLPKGYSFRYQHAVEDISGH